MKYKVAEGFFNLSNNNLTSLEGCPEEAFSFSCRDNKELKSLVGGPKKIKYFYNCSGTGIENFIGAPEELHTVSCLNLPNLKSLKGFPKRIRYELYISGNFPFTNNEIKAVCEVRFIIRRW
jgi:hypothetical protein